MWVWISGLQGHCEHSQKLQVLFLLSLSTMCVCVCVCLYACVRLCVYECMEGEVVSLSFQKHSVKHNVLISLFRVDVDTTFFRRCVFVSMEYAV